MGLTLAGLHSQIDKCVVCSAFVRPLRKPASGLDRGDGRDIFIIGQAPGRTEVTSQRAFSGLSGTRLDEWLVECGRPKTDPRSGVYLTSVLKCPLNKPSDFRGMARRCHHFLESQLEIIKPRLVVTLGRESFEYLRLADGNYDDLIGKLFFPSAGSLLSFHPFEAMVHWPHPSGLNRWHNTPGNGDRLKKSFIEVKNFLAGAS
jgi:uracil-DNA glycosylase family 4